MAAVEDELLMSVDTITGMNTTCCVKVISEAARPAFCFVRTQRPADEITESVCNYLEMTSTNAGVKRHVSELVSDIFAGECAVPELRVFDQQLQSLLGTVFTQVADFVECNLNNDDELNSPRRRGSTDAFVHEEDAEEEPQGTNVLGGLVTVATVKEIISAGKVSLTQYHKQCEPLRKKLASAANGKRQKPAAGGGGGGGGGGGSAPSKLTAAPTTARRGSINANGRRLSSVAGAGLPPTPPAGGGGGLSLPPAAHRRQSIADALMSALQTGVDPTAGQHPPKKRPSYRVERPDEEATTPKRASPRELTSPTTGHRANPGSAFPSRHSSQSPGEADDNELRPFPNLEIGDLHTYELGERGSTTSSQSLGTTYEEQQRLTDFKTSRLRYVQRRKSSVAFLPSVLSEHSGTPRSHYAGDGASVASRTPSRLSATQSSTLNVTKTLSSTSNHGPSFVPVVASAHQDPASKLSLSYTGSKSESLLQSPDTSAHLPSPTSPPANGRPPLPHDDAAEGKDRQGSLTPLGVDTDTSPDSDGKAALSNTHRSVREATLNSAVRRGSGAAPVDLERRLASLTTLQFFQVVLQTLSAVLCVKYEEQLMELTCDGEDSGVVRLAEWVTARIVDELFHEGIDPSQPLDLQLVHCIEGIAFEDNSFHWRKQTGIEQEVLEAVWGEDLPADVLHRGLQRKPQAGGNPAPAASGSTHLNENYQPKKSRRGQSWFEWGVLLQPGVRTATGKLFTGPRLNPLTYKFRVAGETMAWQLGLNELVDDSALRAPSYFDARPGAKLISSCSDGNSCPEGAVRSPANPMVPGLTLSAPPEGSSHRGANKQKPHIKPRDPQEMRALERKYKKKRKKARMQRQQEYHKQAAEHSEGVSLSGDESASGSENVASPRSASGSDAGRDKDASDSEGGNGVHSGTELTKQKPKRSRSSSLLARGGAPGPMGARSSSGGGAGAGGGPKKRPAHAREAQAAPPQQPPPRQQKRESLTSSFVKRLQQPLRGEKCCAVS
ncbi:hypothetical protein DIPPA_16992 [Diplonema papillatum]|nr:hypothetical protein DIPPA_16992 [Diplonema papillatum]